MVENAMKVSEKTSKFSKNLISSAADLILFKIYLGAPWKLVGESSEGGAEGEWQGLENAFAGLPELTPEKVLRALRFLLKQGCIELAPSEAHLVPQITEEGGRHLDSIFPVYNKERPWDEKFYLVNYDIPVGKNSQRDALRIFLKNLGCVMLQSSVWLTPYNPTKELKKFIEKKKLSERVVVSVLLDEWGPPPDVYGLEEVNRRHREFVEGTEGIEGIKGGKGLNGDERMMLAFEYFAILKDDPQLPFELLPPDWAGTRAQEVFEKLFFGK